MKRRNLFFGMALAAMFTFSTPAEAQWGSLINKARNMRDPKKGAVIYFFGFF